MGERGSLVWLRWSLAPRIGMRSALVAGVSAIAPPVSSMPIGAIPVTGSLRVTLGPIAPTAGLLAQGFFLQALELHPSLGAALSSPVHVLLLDPSL